MTSLPPGPEKAAVSKAADRPRASLLRHRDFRLLWGGETVSGVGTQVSMIAIPLVAVVTLHATTFEVGLLTAAETLAFLVVGLPAGAWVDRLHRRPVMITADIARALALASIPAAAALGRLTIVQLYLVVLVNGVLTVFFDVAYQSYLPSLVGREHLVDGNAKLGASQSASQVVGPSLGGGLVQAAGGPYAVLADAASFLVSAVAVSAIRAPEPALEQPAAPRRLRAEVGEGLRFVLGHPLLRAIAGTTGTSNLFGTIAVAVEFVFLVRVLHQHAGVIGVLFAVGSVGGILGALLATRISSAIGGARATILSIVVCGAGSLLLPLATPGTGLVLFAGGVFAFGFGAVVYNVNQVSFRQQLCPDRLLGRMNATMRFFVWGTMPIGGLLGGVIGSSIGTRPTLFIAAAGDFLAVGWLLASPLRTMRHFPAYEAGEPTLETG